MNLSHCLNCSNPVADSYCSRCGQKTDTHRITLKHFLFHDIIHGVWHMERGMLFTIKEALLRPGKAALDYIGGKRIRYYNVFYLILLLIGLSFFIDGIYQACVEKYVSYISIPKPEEADKVAALDFMSRYAKFFLLMAIPFYAFNSYVIFNRKKFLYSEHLIIFGMYFLGVILISLFEGLLIFAQFNPYIAFLAEWSNQFTLIILLVYIINGLYGAFGKDYSKIGFIWRTVVYIILVFAYINVFARIVRFYLQSQA